MATAEPATVLLAHLIGGETLHVADAVLYGLAALGLAAGIALFASGRAGRAEPPPAGLPAPPAGADPTPAAPLVRNRAAREADRTRQPPR